MTSKALPLAAVLALALAAACHTRAPGSAAATSEDSCVYARDGVCDEPVSCGYGTDETDCAAACAAGGSPLLAGACAYRKPVQTSACDPSAVGSGGSVNLVGDRDGSIQVPSGYGGGRIVDRHYSISVPQTYDPKCPAPLVLWMAGHRVPPYSGEDTVYALRRSSDINRFIVVSVEQEWRDDPNEGWKWAWWTDWDWTRPKDNPDIILLRQLVAKMEQDYNVDTTRVFATGHSRGAAMALIAAFEMPDVIAGSAVESGFTEFGYSNRIAAYSGRKVPIVLVHGIIDQDVPIATGGDAIAKQLRGLGWNDDDLLYFRLGNVGHRWQPQLNQQWFDFLSSRPLGKKAP